MSGQKALLPSQFLHLLAGKIKPCGQIRFILVVKLDLFLFFLMLELLMYTRSCHKT
jgi:hypothetical protein